MTPAWSSVFSFLKRMRSILGFIKTIDYHNTGTLSIVKSVLCGYGNTYFFEVHVHMTVYNQCAYANTHLHLQCKAYAS